MSAVNGHLDIPPAIIAATGIDRSSTRVDWLTALIVVALPVLLVLLAVVTS